MMLTFAGIEPAARQDRSLTIFPATFLQGLLFNRENAR
jgi:hypothetical protein